MRMTPLPWLIAVLVLSGLAVARAESVPAHLASRVFPTPTFADVHERFMAIAANESGFKSIADQDGILRALLHGGGGRRAGRHGRGQGYGLDYTKLMRQMARHSKRTFPANSQFLLLTTAQRTWLTKRQTRQNKWASTLKLDCSEPEGWPEKKRDGSPMVSWRYGFRKRCLKLVETTRLVLQGRVRSYCDGQPTTWGSVPDIRRPGGALDQGWVEVHCDRPPDSPETCEELSRQELLNSTTCARNTFWTWMVKDKEDSSDTRSRRPGS